MNHDQIVNKRAVQVTVTVTKRERGTIDDVQGILHPSHKTSKAKRRN